MGGPEPKPEVVELIGGRLDGARVLIRPGCQRYAKACVIGGRTWWLVYERSERFNPDGFIVYVFNGWRETPYAA